MTTKNPPYWWQSGIRYWQSKYWYIFNPEYHRRLQIKLWLKDMLGYFSYAPFALLFFLNFWLAIAFVVFIVLHEFGHYVILKADNNFKKYMIWPTPGCITKRDGLKERDSFVYLTGIIFSLLAYPLFIIAGYNFTYVYVTAILCGSVDLVMFFLYYKVNGHW